MFAALGPRGGPSPHHAPADSPVSAFHTGPSELPLPALTTRPFSQCIRRKCGKKLSGAFTPQGAHTHTHTPPLPPMEGVGTSGMRQRSESSLVIR